LHLQCAFVAASSSFWGDISRICRTVDIPFDDLSGGKDTMLSYLVRRIIYMITTLIMISFIGFGVINLPPGSYLDVYVAQRQNMGTHTAEAELEALNRRYALDQPIYIQYWKWATGFIRGDFGQSFQYNRDVKDLIWERLGYTVLLSIATLLFTWAVAIPIGIYTATNQYKIGDNIATFVGMAGLSIPNFMLALVLMVVAQRYFGQSVGGLFSREYIDAPWSGGGHIWHCRPHAHYARQSFGYPEHAVCTGSAGAWTVRTAGNHQTCGAQCHPSLDYAAGYESAHHHFGFADCLDCDGVTHHWAHVLQCAAPTGYVPGRHLLDVPGGYAGDWEFRG
jgi:hypothetical protein